MLVVWGGDVIEWMLTNIRCDFNAQINYLAEEFINEPQNA
jgi:hypothetical protein